MRTLTAIALSLAALVSTADARPHKPTAKANRAAQEKFVLECVDERTGPDGGIDTEEAFKLCRGIVRHQAKITKLAKRAEGARVAGAAPRLIKRLEWECAEEVSIACEDTFERDHDGGECSDATLEAKHAFAVCRAPVGGVVAKGGK